MNIGDLHKAITRAEHGVEAEVRHGVPYIGPEQIQGSKLFQDMPPPGVSLIICESGNMFKFLEEEVLPVWNYLKF